MNTIKRYIQVLAEEIRNMTTEDSERLEDEVMNDPNLIEQYEELGI